MSNEVLNVQLVETFSWLHDVLIPGGMAILTGLVVGYFVGFALRKKQIKDTRVEELRREKEKALDELISIVGTINDEFPKNTNIMFDFYKYRNEKDFLDKAEEGFNSLADFKSFLISNDFKLEEHFSTEAKNLYESLFDFYKSAITSIVVIGTIRELDKPKYEKEKDQIYDKLFDKIKSSHKEILDSTEKLLDELKVNKKRINLDIKMNIS